MLMTSIFPFSHCFLLCQRKICHLVHLELFITQSLFLTTLSKMFLKTLWEKEKMQVTSIFSLNFQNIFILIRDKIHRFSHFYLLPANALDLERSKILSFSEELSPLFARAWVNCKLYYIYVCSWQ